MSTSVKLLTLTVIVSFILTSISYSSSVDLEEETNAPTQTDQEETVPPRVNPLQRRLTLPSVRLPVQEPSNTRAFSPYNLDPNHRDPNAYIINGDDTINCNRIPFIAFPMIKYPREIICTECRLGTIDPLYFINNPIIQKIVLAGSVFSLDGFKGDFLMDCPNVQFVSFEKVPHFDLCGFIREIASNDFLRLVVEGQCILIASSNEAAKTNLPFLTIDNVYTQDAIKALITMNNLPI